MTCLDDPGSDSIVLTVLRLCLDVCMATCIITFNVFILYAVLRYWKRPVLSSSYTNSTILITSLCVADNVVGLSFVYQFLPRYLCSMAEYSSHNFVACILHSVLVSIGHFASSLTLVAIAVDRYVAVVYALRYPDIMTDRRTFMMIGIAWTTSLLLTTSQFYWNTWTDGEVCETVNFQQKYYELIVLPSVITFTSISLGVIYWRIHRIAITVHNRRLKHDLSTKEKLLTKSARTLLFILIIYIISWYPYVITTLVKKTGYSVSIIFVEVFSSQTKVTYLTNPFIYARNTRPVQQSISKAIASIRRKVLLKRSNTTYNTSYKSDTSVSTICNDSFQCYVENIKQNHFDSSET